MQGPQTKVAPEIVSLIEDTVRESMAPFGFKAAHVRAGEDHDGDPVIFIEADYDLTDTPIDIDVTSKLRLTLRDRLWNMGETRFPHIRNNFDERQPIARPGRTRV